MFEKWFKKQTVSEEKNEDKEEKMPLPYEKILPELEELSENDVEVVKTYLANLKKRSSQKQVSKKNQRTKEEAKLQKESQTKERKLDDEIESAKNELLLQRMKPMEKGLK